MFHIVSPSTVRHSPSNLSNSSQKACSPASLACNIRCRSCKTSRRQLLLGDPTLILNARISTQYAAFISSQIVGCQGFKPRTGKITHKKKTYLDGTSLIFWGLDGFLGFSSCSPGCNSITIGVERFDRLIPFEYTKWYRKPMVGYGAASSLCHFMASILDTLQNHSNLSYNCN
jgi:hypothetical protein